MEVINKIERGKNKEKKEEEQAEMERCIKRMNIRKDPKRGLLYLSMAKKETRREEEEAKPN